MSRRHLIVLAALVAFVFVSSRSIRAAGPRDSLVVSTEWLARHLHDNDLVILTLGVRKTYDAGHIPGAQFVTMDDFSKKEDHANMDESVLSTELPEPSDLHAALQRRGISDRSKIVVYYSDDYFSPSTRVIFALTWAGLGDRVSLLQGGLGAWTRSGQATTTQVPAVSAATLSPLRTQPLVVDAGFIQKNAHTPGIAIVDGRERSSYDGVPAPSRMGSPVETGHIPGALSAPFTEMFNEQGALRPAVELQQVFDKAGVKPNDIVVGYCWVGQQATAMLFAARTLGYEVKLYDGSINDWKGHLKLPLEGAKKGGDR